MKKLDNAFLMKLNQLFTCAGKYHTDAIEYEEGECCGVLTAALWIGDITFEEFEVITNMVHECKTRIEGIR